MNSADEKRGAPEPSSERVLRRLSVVVPCFNEVELLEQSCTRILNVLRSSVDGAFELVCVDDGSRDGTLDGLKKLRARHAEIRVLSFSRNFGHQVAVSAGMDYAQGDAVVLIDADLQDPPELIPQMIERWRAGADVVYGVRMTRGGESIFKRASASVFYRLLDKLSDVSIPVDTGDFRLMDRRVVDVLRAMPERDRFIRGMVAWAGFRQEALPYQRDPRTAGESKYPLHRMVRFAFDGVTSFSTRPLRLATWLGFSAATFAMIGVVYAILIRLMTKSWVPGWAALFVAVLFMGGIQLIAIGVIGEYVGRLFMQVKARPMYVVAEHLPPAESPTEV